MKFFFDCVPYLEYIMGDGGGIFRNDSKKEDMINVQPPTVEVRVMLQLTWGCEKRKTFPQDLLWKDSHLLSNNNIILIVGFWKYRGPATARLDSSRTDQGS